jgi:TusA-related sulfurtransferase
MSDRIEVDLTGLRCPMPIVELHRLLKKLEAGQQISVFADDPAFCLDVETWCRKTGHQLISLKQDEHKLVALIEKVDPDKKTV